MKTLDLFIALISAAAFALTYFYNESEPQRQWLLWLFGFIALLFLLLALARKKPGSQRPVPRPGGISELVLLSEENTEVARWDLYGKTGLVIGRDVGENHVDINLLHTTYASMVDLEHAVLNYSGSCWYIEDIVSKNGLSVQKLVDGRKYHLGANQPCKLEKGDVLYIGLTRLLIR